MKRLLILLLLVFGLAYTSEAKVRHIDIKQSLNDAKVIQRITVLRYSESQMFYIYENQTDTFLIDCKLRQYSESDRLLQIEKGFMKSTDLAGKWPDVSETVLIVINRLGRIELFASEIGDKYRFWDPNLIPFANSVFVIKKERPYIPLPDCREQVESDLDYWWCSDGCLALQYDINNMLRN